MLQSSFDVRKTHVGQALFAKCAFNTGDQIAPISGKVFSEDEHESQYCMDLGDGTVLEPNEPLRYLNHSCEPNCQREINGRH